MKVFNCFACFLALALLAGCVTHDQRLEALGHPVVTRGLIWDMFEADLRRFLARREHKNTVLARLGGEQVPNETYFDTFYLTFDGQPTDVPPATRAQWKREYRLSAETFAVFAEDNNHIILFFDQSGRLRQYEHVNL